jgi:hypothetical protein
MNSCTYQLTWEPNGANRGDETNCSHALVQRLEAEVLLDSMAQVVDVPVRFQGQPLGVRAIQLPGVQPRDRRNSQTHGEKFLRTFGKPDRLLSCDCERNADDTIPQSLLLLGGEPLLSMLGEPDNRIGRQIAAGLSDAQIIDDYFLAALSRTPNDIERRSIEAHLKKVASRREALEDVGWAVLNTKEFLFRR